MEIVIGRIASGCSGSVTDNQGELVVVWLITLSGDIWLALDTR